MSEHNYHIFWDEALRQIHEHFKQKDQENEFLVWFSSIKYVEDTLKEITVSVPSEFVWSVLLDKKYISIIQDKIKELSGQTVELVHTIVAKTEPADTSTLQRVEHPSSQESTNVILPSHPSKKSHPQLNELYTFDNFVPGGNSDYAYSACLAAAKFPGQTYTPMLLYGGVGLGKTHLMEAIGNYIYEERNGNVKICYTTLENFLNEFTSSLQHNKIEQFKSKYRNLDVLLLDDIQFLENKKQLQEELFYTFEALDKKKSQIVFTCDRPINKLEVFEDRLSTRFGKGMTVDLQPPDYETRRAILQKKLELQKKTLPEEFIDYIAENVQTNVRELEACLIKLTAYAELTGRTLTMEMTQRLLADTLIQPTNKFISIDTIQRVVANRFEISLNDIKSKKRSKRFVYPRQIAIYIARNMLEYSYPELGDEFGGRDHTTMMHSCEVIEEQLKSDQSLRETIQTLTNEIKTYKK